MASQPDAFNYIVAIQLVIVAIGITKILEGVSWIIEHKRTCHTYWPHTLSALLVGLLLLQYAWTSFYDYSVSRWTFGDFLLECATPLIYLFVADLLFPNGASPSTNLRAVYADRIRIMAALVITAQVVNCILDFRYHPGESLMSTLMSPKNLVRGVSMCVLAGLLMPFPKWELLHKGIIIILVSALLVFCVLLTPAIEIGACVP